ncbi:GTPase Era [Candidatus Cloacimonadota bacterium]
MTDLSNLKSSSFKAGFVSIVGKPNVGKSTLLNLILKEKISIISPKPQTTRQQVKGIFTDDEKQIVFLDTPGYVKSRYELHNKMREYLINSMNDSDLIIFITDAHKFPTDYDQDMLTLLHKMKTPKIAILNKIDLVDPEIYTEKVRRLSSNDFEEVIPLSLINKVDVDNLLGILARFLPYNPPFYSPDDVSDQPLRFFVQEIIREKIFHNYRDELPYASTVVVESYKDFPNKVEIAANIWLERNSQKPILIGRNGENIRKLRQQSEKDIHTIVGKRVKLELWVKIKPNWRKKKNTLKEFGYI